MRIRETGFAYKSEDNSEATTTRITLWVYVLDK